MTVKGTTKYPKVRKVCEWCHEEFLITQHRSINRRFCNRKCMARWVAKTRKSTKGRYTTTKGYVLLYKPGHPTATKAGYIMEHRFVMEQVLGRFLQKTEIVHHLDGNKQNNQPENLVVMEKIRHDKQTLKGRKYMVICPHCGKSFRTKNNAHYVAEN